MRIQHNIMAMNAYRNYNTNTKALSGNLEKLSSGYKINRAGDDAAGLAISEKMRAQITGLDAAQKNVKDGISLVKTAEGAMQEIQDMLNRMDYLATQSANGTYQNEVDRENLQKEVENLKTEINRIADSANFNGIKLLDGSLDEAGSTKAINSVKVSGIDAYDSDAIKGIYEAGAAAPTGSMIKMMEGSGFEYTVSLDDGTSYTAKFTVERETDEGSANYNKLAYLVAEDGTKYDLAATASLTDGATIDNAVFNKALAAELKKTGLNDDYKITCAGQKVKLEARQAGTDTPKASAFDCSWTKDGATWEAKTDMGVDIKQSPLNAGLEIKADDVVLYDGTNYDKAVFEINGKKFVVMSGNDTAAGTDWFNATKGLGSDVTILVGNDDGEKGLTVDDENFTQNVAKIAQVTGLTVTNSIDESSWDDNMSDNEVGEDEGIRLTPGKSAQTKGSALTLQIGDTADDFNQMKVFVGDMHTKAMGIADVDIGTQEGAAAAIQTIKDAINYVSSVRGDLGAVQNRLEHTGNNLSVMAENIQDAESTIRDTDVANEMMSYVKNNILVQSAQAMLAQANQVPQGVLQLLG